MKKECMPAAVVLLLAIASIGCISNKQESANQLLGEWCMGIADPEGEKGFIFREDAIWRFDEKHLYMQDGEAAAIEIEYAMDGNYLVLLEEGERARMRIQFTDKNTFILYMPSIAEMLGETPPDKNVVIIGGDEKPFIAGRRK